MPNTLNKVIFRHDGENVSYYISNSVSGYLNEEKTHFYEEDTLTTVMPDVTTLIYIDLTDNYLYRYDEDTSKYVLIGGDTTHRDPIKYVTTLPGGNEIENIIYATVSRTNYNILAANNFLDDVLAFEKTVPDPEQPEIYTYYPVDGVEVEASVDNITYKRLTSIGYDGISNWTITYTDSTIDTLVDSNTFYYKLVNRNYYAGSVSEENVTLIASNDLDSKNLYTSGVGVDITNNTVSLLPAQDGIIGGVKPDGTTTIIDSNGTLSSNYVGGYGIKVNQNEISTKTFVGTQADWNALSSADQAKFDSVNITDDHTELSAKPGHIVLDDNGDEIVQRDHIRFDDCNVTDDSTTDTTVVTPVPYIAGDKISISNHVVGVDNTVKGTFIGTKEEWNSLTSTEKAKYEIVSLTNDLATGGIAVVDELVKNNYNPCSSNAVAQALSWSLIASGTADKSVSNDFNKYNEIIIIGYKSNSIICSTLVPKPVIESGMRAQCNYSNDSTIELELTSMTVCQITMIGTGFDAFKIYGR